MSIPTNDDIITWSGFPEKFKVPFIAWNRIEGRPRHEEFNESIEMSVHDPLWMMARQWQFGEYKGEDRGSAIMVKMAIESKLISHHGAVNVDALQDFNKFPDDLPLEVLIERLSPKFTVMQKADMGRMFFKKLTKAHGSSDVALEIMISEINNSYRFVVPDEPTVDTWDSQPKEVSIHANDKLLQMISTFSGKIPDGWKIFTAILQDDFIALNGFSGDELELKNSFEDWMKKTYSLPEMEHWFEAEMNYKYKIAHNSDTVDTAHDVMIASDYRSGKIDWYSFDRVGKVQAGLSQTNDHVSIDVVSAIPTPARFKGMPHKRLWKIEDAAVNFANFNIDSSEIVKQILAEYALVYSNDWFILPYTFPLNSRNRLKGMIVTDVFGIKTLMKSSATESALVPSSENELEPWNKWGYLVNDVVVDKNSIVNNAVLDLNTADDSIFIAPTISSSMSSEPYEEVHFLRDEVDNRAWAIETRIFDQVYGGVDGKLASEKLKAYINNLLSISIVQDDEYYAQLVYQLGDAVPENWIPFVPVRKNETNNRSIKLQRASLPRFIDSGTKHIRPRNSILRLGLSDNNEQLESMFINEEVIPRSGISLSDHYQRTRWHGGKTLLWYGRKVKSASYPVSSGLSFDNIILKSKDEILLISLVPLTNVEVVSSFEQISMAWIDSSQGVEGYRIMRRQDSDNVFKEIADISGDQRLYKDTDVSPYTNYTYKIITYSKTGSVSSDEISVLSQGILSEVVNVQLKAYPNAVNISWIPNSLGLVDYSILRSSKQGSDYVEIASKLIHTNYTDNFLQPSTKYFYKIVVHGFGSSIESQPFIVTTLAVETNVVLVKITDFTFGEVKVDSIQLKWTDNSIGEDHYSILRSFSNRRGYESIATVDKAETSYTDSRLINNTLYYYKIIVHGGNRQVISDPISIRTLEIMVGTSLSELYDIKEVIASSSVGLSWKDDSIGVLGYKVLRSNVIDRGYVQIGDDLLPAQRSFVDKTVEADTVYYYKIVVFGDNVSLETNPIRVKTDTELTGVLLSKITLDEIIPHVRFVEITWNDVSVGAEGYVIYREVKGRYVKIGLKDTRILKFIDTKLRPDTFYNYKIEVYAGKNSVLSDVISTKTLKDNSVGVDVGVGEMKIETTFKVR